MKATSRGLALLLALMLGCLCAGPGWACIGLDVANEMDPSGLNTDFYCYGPLYSKVTLSGCGGFQAASAGPEGAAGTQYFTQILLEQAGSGRTFIVADSHLRSATPPDPRASLSGRAPRVAWSDTEIVFRLQKFWEDANGNYICDGEPGTGENVPVPLSEVTPGDYSARLRTVYWVDWNGNGVFDQPNPLDPDDPANEATVAGASDPVLLTITTQPYIRKVKPRPVVAGGKAVLVGINFGETQGESTINIYRRDGETLITQLTAESRRVRRWQDNRIKFRMRGKAGQVRRVSVTTGGIESNRVKVRLVSP